MHPRSAATDGHSTKVDSCCCRAERLSAVTWVWHVSGDQRKWRRKRTRSHRRKTKGCDSWFMPWMWKYGEICWMFFSCGIFCPVSDYVNSWFPLRAWSLEIRDSNVSRSFILSTFSTFFALDFFYSISKLKSTIDIAELDWTGFVPIESSSLEICFRL